MTTTEKALATYDIYAKERDKKGVKDVHIARAAGMRPSTISDWKHGHYTPKHDKLVAISKVLEIPVQTFYLEE